MRTVDVRRWLDRTGTAITATTERLEKAKARFEEDADIFARDQQQYEKSRMLLARASLVSRDVIDRAD